MLWRNTSRLVQRVTAGHHVPNHPQCMHSEIDSPVIGKLKKKTKTLIIKELVNLFYGTTVWTSGTFTSSRSFGVIVFLFGLYFLFQIFSKAFDSQDGKQLEESESTPSLLEQVQVGFYRCILMNYQWRDFLNSDRFELSNKNIFLLSLFNMSFCLVGVFLL